MKDLVEAIEALRSAVSGPNSSHRTALRDAIDESIFGNPEVAFIPGEETLAYVSVAPVRPTTVEELERVLGDARRLPRNPSGGDRTVMFAETLPDEGECGATVLAEVDDDDRVSRLIIRRDAF